MGQNAGSSGEHHDHAVAESAAASSAEIACRSAVDRLTAASIPTEALAEYITPRRAFLRTKPATMRAIGEVWRLGSLLLDTEARLYTAGHATRSAERGRPGYQSVSKEERREIAAAALRGGYPIGTAVNYDAIPVPFPFTPEGFALGNDGPVGLSEGELRVRWRAGAPLEGAPSLANYLAERVGLLTDPPLGAD